ncbi:coenzyme F420-0:L-glutamate ligase [Gulosibacter chungangensis]|uniref:Coenzyme F420-0:L-glutamate ligase n=1 Tax=Gulosibacter chungangensis TaxID=979746 RepID=A0A7J5BFU6_9MICO|nr:coenzyme F420-0:L-glutamate ligase [Gulosibacter chungangensis]KAB1645153.1 coenzyme F420-0:L-glutamate ligase [Gulosibacter chungangensis]
MSVWALTGIPEIQPGDDLVEVILAALERDPDEPLEDGDILVITSKILSKAEGRIVEAEDREEAIRKETVRVVATRPREGGGATMIVENRLGIIGAAAGVDASNTAEGTVLLLPVDPDGSARQIAERMRAALGVEIGIIVSDTLGRPWREGQTDVAIGAAGVHVFEDYAGKTDAAGRPLAVTMPCLADELAGATDLVKRKSTGNPVAVVRGLGHIVGGLDLPGAAAILRPAERDFFRLGTDLAFEQGFDAGVASVRGAGGSSAGGSGTGDSGSGGSDATTPGAQNAEDETS